MNIKYGKMVFGKIGKMQAYYPAGEPAYVSWGVKITADGQARTLMVSGHNRRSDLRGEVQALKRGAYGLRASDTTPTAWCLVPRPSESDAVVYFHRPE